MNNARRLCSMKKDITYEHSSPSTQLLAGYVLGHRSIEIFSHKWGSQHGGRIYVKRDNDWVEYLYVTFSVWEGRELP